MDKKVYTIDDIARELGVSKTTVSRALSGKGRVGRETKERVLAFVKEHHYRQQVLAKAMEKKKTYNLGLVLPSIYAMTEFPFFQQCMSSVCETANHQNYDVLLTIMEGNDYSRLEQQVNERKVDGVIITRATTDDKSMINMLLEKEMPFVLIGPSDNENILSVDNSNREGCRALVSMLLRRGMRRIALITGSSSHQVNGQILKGYRDAIRAYGMDVNEGMIFQDMETRTHVEEAVAAAVKAGASGIVCADDVITLQVLEFLRKRGIRVPTDLLLASCYDAPLLESSMPSITSVHFDTGELSVNACRMLIDEIEERTVTRKAPANYQVIRRESTEIE